MFEVLDPALPGRSHHLEHFTSLSTQSDQGVEPVPTFVVRAGLVFAIDCGDQGGVQIDDQLTT